MKKIVLSLAGVLVATAFAPEASALPVFARQTGMACSACHFQHFPLLNGFGRAFKTAGFTMMGAQGKIEGDRLSIPDTLNMAVLTSMGYEKSNMAPLGAATVPAWPAKNTGNGVFFLPGVAGESSLFFGGRISENAGFLSEVGLSQAAALGSAKLPMMYEVGGNGVRIGAVPFVTDAQGASYGMETLNTGANAVHQISNTPGFDGSHANAISAQQYISTAGAADGVALVASSDMGFVSVTKWNLTGSAQATFASLGSTYMRLVGNFDVAGWDSAVGVQSWSGQSWEGVVAGVAQPTLTETKATAIDGQMQGELGGMPTGFYFSYAKAPASTVASGITNLFSTDPHGLAATLDRSSLNINAEVGLVPEVVTVAAAIRRGKSGVADAVTGTNLTDNAIYLTATYKIAQNMLARLSYTTQSGGYWSQANKDAFGSKTTTVNIYTLF